MSPEKWQDVHLDEAQTEIEKARDDIMQASSCETESDFKANLEEAIESLKTGLRLCEEALDEAGLSGVVSRKKRAR